MAETPEEPTTDSPGLDPNLAAAISYLWITAIIFLLLEPFNKNRFVRFHCFQSLALGIAWIVISVVLSVIPILGWILLLFLPLVALILVLLCAWEAYQNKWFKLPVIGDFAEKQAGPAG